MTKSSSPTVPMLNLHIQKALKGGQGPVHLDFSYALPQTGILAIMGPSGIGKTSILRMIAGLMKPDSGTISVAGETWYDSTASIHLPPQKRNVGFVFQDYGLFPNMTVEENLAFALHKDATPALISEILNLMELGELTHQRPLRLSGGQQQRVALARAIVQQPQLLLLDEPLAALDTSTRIRLQQDLKRMHTRFGFTTILVSHDLREVAQLADEVVILAGDGSILQSGHPTDLFAQSPDENWKGEVIRIADDLQEMFVLTDSGIWRLPYQKQVKIGMIIHLKEYL